MYMCTISEVTARCTSRLGRWLSQIARMLYGASHDSACIHYSLCILICASVYVAASVLLVVAASPYHRSPPALLSLLLYRLYHANLITRAVSHDYIVYNVVISNSCCIIWYSYIHFLIQTCLILSHYHHLHSNYCG